MTVPVAFINTVFNAGVTTRAEARAWLTDGGWPQFEAWLAAHRRMPRLAPPPKPRTEDRAA